jgi:hypothetical protein
VLTVTVTPPPIPDVLLGGAGDDILLDGEVLFDD